MITDILLRPDGMEFGVTIQPKSRSVDIFYENKNIWHEMLYCFVPRKNETLDMLERRIAYSFSNWHNLLEDREHYSPLPAEFIRKMGTKEKAKIIVRAIAGQTYSWRGVGIIELGMRHKKTLWHETLHNAFWDNPFLRKQLYAESAWDKYDLRFLPLPYNPRDEYQAYCEMMPESLYPTSFMPVPFQCFPRPLESLAVIGSIGASMAFESAYPLILTFYVAACNIAKVPRTIVSAAKGYSYRRNVRKIKEKLGEGNALRLMMISGPKELKTLADICEGI